MKLAQNIKSFPKKNPHQQRGLTMISWIFVLAILAFCGVFGFTVVPMYAENMYVENALKSLVEPGGHLNDMSDSEIRKRLQNFYMVNNVRNPGAQNIEIDRTAKTLIVTVDYEIRAKLFYNIEIVTSFQNHLDADDPKSCCKPSAELRESKH